MKKVLLSFLGLIMASSAVASSKSIPTQYRGTYCDFPESIEITSNKINYYSSGLEEKHIVESVSVRNGNLVVKTRYTAMNDLGRKTKGKKQVVLKRGKNVVEWSGYGIFSKGGC